MSRYLDRIVITLKGRTPSLLPMPGHQDGDPDKTKEEYDDDNHADQENPNNEEYDK